MRFGTLISFLAGATLLSGRPISDGDNAGPLLDIGLPGIVDVGITIGQVVTPKVFIISMFDPEANIWYTNGANSGSIGDIFAINVTIPGFSPLYPQAHCLADGSVCQLTTGESEINAAATITALVLSPVFDLSTTYFLIAGIAGVNPKHGTIGDVIFPKYAVQVGLQHEFDAREIPDNFTSGYVPLGSHAPDQYPRNIYGTEVFEINEALRDIAVNLAKTAKLSDSSAAKSYRARYAQNPLAVYQAATKTPGIRTCDVATSDVYYSGAMLGEAFENTTTLFTNGSGIYCATAQEDNATLEALLRAATRGAVDFARVIIMRSASNFERPPAGLSGLDNLFYMNQGGFGPSIENLYRAGTPIISKILEDWSTHFAFGIKPTNYIGDIFGTLGGTPDFGPAQLHLNTEADYTVRGRSRRGAWPNGPMRNDE